MGGESPSPQMRRMRNETQVRSVRVKGLASTHRGRGKSWDLICVMHLVKMQWQVTTPAGKAWVPPRAPASLLGSSYSRKLFKTWAYLLMVSEHHFPTKRKQISMEK